ncbi:MAG: PQQ-dependent sugar dehydrogenase [Pseudomonadota bacterium]|nr:PQQ-dependent sugar dehydrogenase [Pseudomonadota bacterium]
MVRSRTFVGFTGLGLLAGVAAIGPAQAAVIGATRVAAGLNQPLFATAAPGDPQRLFVVERGGTIRILDLNSNSVGATPFLSIPNVPTNGELGLLGMAFHPDFASNGFFYVNVSENSGPTGISTSIRRYQVSADPNLADPGSETRILSFSQPQANHNAGWIGFGPNDGFLYVPTGDGGGANDSATGHTPGIGNAQDLTDNLLGKLLRLDVDGDDFPADAQRNYAIPADNPFVGVDGDDEIWAYGLRNPFRAGFDRLTGDLYIGDVGQNNREEIDVQPAASDGGENYGWRLREGTIATPTPVGSPVGGPRPPGAIDPIYDYGHGGGPLQGNSVTGGYVYRGPIASLQGNYFFADFSNDRLWSLRFDGSDPSTFDGTNFTGFIDWTDLLIPDAGSIGNVAGFGEDAAGNLYIVDLIDGEVFRIVQVAAPNGAWLVLAGLALIAPLRRAGRWPWGRRRGRKTRPAG